MDMTRRLRCGASIAALVLVVAGCSDERSATTTRSTASETVTAASSPSPGCATRDDAEAGSSTRRSDRRTLTVAGASRTYLLTRPAAPADRTEPAPVVILFHGAGANAQAFADATRLPAKGAQAGAVVVMPDGLDHNWQLAGDGADAAFVDAMLDDVAAATCIDERRVTASGFSSGAIFATAYGCAHPDRISGVVTVAAEIAPDCHDRMPTLAIHGTSDPFVPYRASTMAEWATLNGCNASPKVKSLGSEVVRHVWSDCVEPGAVVLYEITGGGHTWPGSDEAKVPKVVRDQSGLTTQQIDASALTTAFAKVHRLQP